MNIDDLFKIRRLIDTSKVEYGGTLRVGSLEKQKLRRELQIHKLYKGDETGVDIKDKRSKILFHIHTDYSVHNNCKNNFPSLLDIQEIVRDKLEHDVLFHLIFVSALCGLGVFIVEPLRSTPLKLNRSLLQTETLICNNKISLRDYIAVYKKENIKINFKILKLY